ncbi:hypothetical protein [Halorientalis salina]|uniref:hypothetical protein n=1 Tax=Halorientalis salina TaxID=2932266 RepID=UPI0010AD3D85|nr:hypothetical protein [Halorientalis salina]
MTQPWDEFREDIASGDAERANRVVDQIGEWDIDECVRSFDDCFNGVTTLYVTSDDGYVRQSCVRVASELAPGLGAAVNLEDEQASSPDRETIADQTDALCGFFLEAMTDGDGRVRQSAKRGLEDVFRTYDALDDRDTIEAIRAELDAMATHYDGKQREHLHEAKRAANTTLESGLARMVRDVAEELE